MAGAQTRGGRGGRADSFGGPTASDLAGDRRARRERDAPLERAYRAGRDGGDRSEFETSDELAGYFDQGAGDRRREDRGERVGQARDKGLDLANDGAGFILGLFAYALLVNYLQGGRKGARAWIAAKFLNRTSADAAKAKAPAKPSSPSSPAVPD